MILMASICNAEEPSRNYIDDLGRNVSIPAQPERIISLSPSNTEMLFALGLQDRIIGVTRYCNYPPEIEGLKEDGRIAVVGGFKDPDLEAVLSLKPDLVFAGRIHARSIIPELENAGIPVYATNPVNLSTVMLAMQKMGEITGEDEMASMLLEEMQSRIDSISEKVADLPKKRVFYLLWYDPIQTAGKETVQDEEIEMAGGENIFHNLTGYPKIDSEATLKANPEIIITGTGMGSQGDDAFNWTMGAEALNGTDAKRYGRVYQLEGDLLTRAGPRTVDALEALAALIHPEAFEGA